MAVSNKPDVAKKLAALQSTFKQQLPGKLAEINGLWETAAQNTMSMADLSEFYRLVHSLTGSGGTFGAIAASNICRELESILKPYLKTKAQPGQLPSISIDTQHKINDLLAQLKPAAEAWHPSSIPYIKPGEAQESRIGNLIYLVEDDELLASGLVIKLEQADFQVEYFSDLADFEAAFEKKVPAAIIMDVVFKEGDLAGADVISRLKAKVETYPPVIFISVRDDIDVRLAVARAGAHRYFCKPLDEKKLIQTLIGLTARTTIKPFRVLIVDDDEILLEYYSTILSDSGMVVEALSNPLQGLSLMTAFKPDVVVLDVYMPECSGPELAQVIRQDDAWAMTPILFLSTETDINRQLKAMNLGGDDFLVKPVEADYLVSSVTARARRSRWTHRLNDDLNNVLRENKFQLVTMDQHAIVSTADVAGQIIDVNDNFCEISGYSRAELLGQNHRIVKSDYHPVSFYEEMWGSISQGKVWRGTICNRKKEGGEYWVESTIVPFLDAKGKPYKYVSARTDISRLKTSEERLHRSQLFANIGTWDWDIKTGELYWSDRIAPLFGYLENVPETSYENFLATVHPDDRQMVVDAVNACVEKGADYNIEHRVVWTDGSIHWVSEKGDVVRAEDGAALHMLGAVQDIDARKRGELMLAENKRQLLEAQTLANIGSWQADLITGELSWSDEIYRIFGYEPGSFEPSIEAFHAAVHPDDLEKVRESEKRAEQTGSHDVTHRIVKPDGTINYVHELAKAEVDAAGNLLRLTGTVQDVTAVMEADIRQQSNARILEMIAVGQPLKDVLEALVLHGEALLSDSMCSILLLDPSGKHLQDGVALSLPDFYNEAIDGIEIGMGAGSCGEAAFSGERVIVSDIMTHPNWVGFKDLAQQAGLRACWSEPFFSTSGVVLGTFSVYFPEPNKPDKSDFNFLLELAQFAAIAVEQELSQRALMDAKEDAENANRAKSQFLSSMSHELRTPMNAIMGFGQLLTMEKDPPLSESQTENVEEIVKAGSHLLELINEVLDLARIEAGRIDLSIETVALGEVISDSLQLILPLLQKRGIEVGVSQNGIRISLEQLGQQHNAVRADRTRLRQVLLNLLSNAVKYNCENGKLSIACYQAENKQTRISITDTGEGISAEQQEQLFKAFNRLGADKTEIEGTGIGLVITKNIVELMGGNIGVESQRGEGSTFWVELPSDTLPFDQIAEKDSMSEANEAVPADSSDYEHTVLYIEDNPANLRLVTQLLGRLDNIHMWSAHEPMLGLELADEHNPDLILLDINLPGMDGFGVLEQLRKRESTRNTPVIAISANAMPGDIKKGMDAGFDDYITKPINVKELLKAVDKFFSESGLE